MNQRASLKSRRLIGAYYTPERLADTICQWAVRKKTDFVLEPSFGGCELVSSTYNRLQELGCQFPLENMIGADIDPFAFNVLEEKWPGYSMARRFLKEDFLSVKPSDYLINQVDVVVGNPPYVRHHGLSDIQRTFANNIKSGTVPKLNLQSNLWAYFVIHACSFLKKGGRAAWILPKSFIDACYSYQLKEFLRTHFKEIRIFVIRERLFSLEGASESTVVVLANEYSPTSALGTLEYKHISKATDLLKSIQYNIAGNGYRNGAENIGAGLYNRGSVLGKFCSLRIGLVTGDSGYFLFNKSKALRFGLNENFMRLIISRSKHLTGAKVTESDIICAFGNDQFVRMLDTSNDDSPLIKEYLKLKSETEISSNATFKKRLSWHQPFDGKVSDAFLSGMSHNSPRLVLNPDGIPCTNSLYRVYFNDNVSDKFKAILVLSMSSSYSKFSSEIEGRQYGSGLLKHEIGDALRIRVCNVDYTGADLPDWFNKLDDKIRNGKLSEATDIADDFLIHVGFLNFIEVQKIRRAVNLIQSDRHYHKS